MLPKNLRLVQTKEILQAMRTKYQTRTNHLHIRLRPTGGDFRLLVIVSKKISKRANKRNLLRRRVHAIFEELKQKNQLPGNVTIVVQVIKKDLVDLEFSSLKKELLDGVGKLYLKYNHSVIQKKTISKV